MANIIRYTGTGRAKCGSCRKIIKNGEETLEARAYRDCAKFCRRCIVKELFNLKTNKQIDEVSALVEMTK